MSKRLQRPIPGAVGLLGAMLLLACLVFLGIRAGDAGAVAAKTLGASGRTPPPSCPRPKHDGFPSYKECNAFGHVTGFQISADGERAIFKAPEDGKIVAWSVKTSVPRTDPANPDLVDERAVFEQKLSDETFDRYGGNPTAGISILKEVGPGKFLLAKRSPIVELNDSLGSRPIFTLDKPLRIQKGRVVALTTPTWVTNFALADPSGNRGLSDKYAWRASRRPDRCETTTNPDGTVNDDNLTKLSHPHVRVGSEKKYGCVYRGADILYWAYYVPDRSGK